jgi:hypothetical protein
MHTLLQKNLNSAYRAIHDGKRRIASVSNKSSSDAIAFCRLSLPACLPEQRPSPPIHQSLMKTCGGSMALVAIPWSGMGRSLRRRTAAAFSPAGVGQEAERAVVYSGDRRRRAGTGEVVRALVVDVVYKDPSHHGWI